MSQPDFRVQESFTHSDVLVCEKTEPQSASPALKHSTQRSPVALKCNRVDSSQGQIYPVSPSYGLIPFLGRRGVTPALC